MEVPNNTFGYNSIDCCYVVVISMYSCSRLLSQGSVMYLWGRSNFQHSMYDLSLFS